MMKPSSLSQWPRGMTLGLLLTAIALSAGTLYYTLGKAGMLGSAEPQPSPSPTSEPIRAVSALGRLEPVGTVITLAAPVSLDGDRVAELRVKLGDRVTAGQVIAVLDAHGRLQAEVRQAEEAVQVARAKLAQVQAGAKQGQLQAQRAEIVRSSAQTQGEETIQREAIARIQAQWSTDQTAQQANLERITAQWEGDRRAQQATIRRLDAQRQTAQAELNRNQQLFDEGAISQSALDSKRLVVTEITQGIQEAEAIAARINRTAQQELNSARAILEQLNRTSQARLSEAQAELERIRRTGRQQTQVASATLNEIAEVRPVDVQAATAELNQAIATLKRAQIESQTALVKAPMAGQILKIHTYPGEKLNSEGLVEIGNTDKMQVIAEVYQSDINRIQLGQTASITGQAFTGKLVGKVVEIGRQINRQTVFSSQPGENLDRRIIEVKIQLSPEASKTVANFTNLQVQVVIQP